MSDLYLTNNHYYDMRRSELLELTPRYAEQILSVFIDWRVDDRIDPKNYLR